MNQDTRDFRTAAERDAAPSQFPPPPPVSAELIRVLDQRYPESCPDPNMTDREIWIYAGKRQLIRELVQLNAAQKEP